MKLDELLHRFQGDLQIRNYSARTVTDYGYNLALLFQFLEQRQITDIQSVTSRPRWPTSNAGFITSRPSRGPPGAC